MPIFHYTFPKALVLLFCIVLLPNILRASGVRGSILDEAGNPLAYTTIFVQETGSGAVSNQQGAYEVRLTPGKYTLIFQFLGYQTEERRVQVDTAWVTLNIRMKIQPIELNMAGINLNGEDPAYTVMRKAIAKAAFHRQQVDSYKTQVYVKGSGRILKAPIVARRALKKSGIDSTMAFTLESVSQIEYKRPNTFKEKVISIRSQGIDNSTSPMPFIQSSFYEPKVQDAISPLSPNAFGFYRFKLESFFLDRGYGVNKIKVTPRNPGENVFEGYLYIVEDYWSIYSLALSTFQQGIRFQINQVYAPIEKQAWLPVSYKFLVDGNILGFVFEYNYLATSGKYTVQLNPELADSFQVIDDKLAKALALDIPVQKPEKASLASVEKRLSTGDEVTPKELRKILKEYETQEKKTTDEPEVVLNKSITIDSQAYAQDSTYWERIRPIPLSELEVKGYRFRDSIVVKEAEEERKKAAEDSLSISGSPMRSDTGAFTLLSLLTGKSYTFGKIHRIAHDDLLTRFFFNPVDGFNLNANIKYNLLKGVIQNVA